MTVTVIDAVSEQYYRAKKEKPITLEEFAVMVNRTPAEIELLRNAMYRLIVTNLVLDSVSERWIELHRLDLINSDLYEKIRDKEDTDVIRTELIREWRANIAMKNKLLNMERTAEEAVQTKFTEYLKALQRKLKGKMSEASYQEFKQALEA